jgi:hypothetical protein
VRGPGAGGFGRPFHETHQDSAVSHGDLIGLAVWRAMDSTLREASPMSEFILHKKARQLCIGEGKAWSLKDFENGVPGVTMLTVVADEKKRREYLDRAKLMLRRNLR